MGKWLILTLFGLISFLPSDASSRLIGITYTFEPYADAVVSINEFTAATVDIGSTGFYFLNSLAQNSSGVFYTVSDDASDPQLIRIDPTTWSGRTETRISFYSGSARPRIRGLAFDPGDDLFAIHHTRPAFAPREEEWDTELYLINKGSGSMAPIGATGFTGIQSITFSPDGETLYGWDVHEGLVTIDTTTGRATNVNPRVRGTAEIQGIAFAPDGTLFGAQYELFIIDVATGEYTLVGRTGRNVRGLEYVPDYIEPQDRGRRSVEPQNKYLVDCGPCPHCLGLEKPCDPRINPDFDRFLLWDPQHDIAISFSRSKLGFKMEDGPLQAAAPVKDGKDRLIFAVTAPFADSENINAGAVLFYDASGKVLYRINGKAKEERLGLDMDVRDAEVVVVSTQRLLRLRHGKVFYEMALAKDLFAHRGARVAFTDDVDGDANPEILLGVPYANVGQFQEAGQIQVIGSRDGKIIDIHYGRRSGQNLGKTLWPIGAKLNRTRN